VLRKLQIVFQNVAISEKKKWEYCNRIIPLNSFIFRILAKFRDQEKKEKKRKETLSEGTRVQGGVQIH
jgi:hypothetical protein